MVETLNAVQYAQRVRQRSVGPILLAEAGSAKEGARRIVSYSVVGQGLKLLDDRHIDGESAPQLGRILLGSRPATCDAKPGEPARLVWCEDGESIKLWADLRLRVGARPSGIEVRGSSGTKSLPRSSVRAIRVTLSDIWDTLRVEAVLGEGKVGLTAKTDRSVLRDPRYDEEDLVRDNAWLVDFARAVAQRVGAPLQLPEELQ